MKTYFLAILISFVLSTKVIWQESSPVKEVDVTPNFDDSTKRGMIVQWGTSKFHYSGRNGEYDLNFLLMGGKVGLGMSKRTGLNVLEDGNIVMQWYQHIDPDSPGNFQSFTCTVKYNDTSTLINATEVEVLSYYGQ